MPLLASVVSAAAFTGAVQSIVADPLMALLSLLLLSSGADWLYRKRAARAAAHIFQTNGLAAVVLGVGLMLEDISSIEAHQVILGERPIFLLSAALASFRNVLQRLVPAPRHLHRPHPLHKTRAPASAGALCYSS